MVWRWMMQRSAILLLVLVFGGGGCDAARDRKQAEGESEGAGDGGVVEDQGNGGSADLSPTGPCKDRRDCPGERVCDLEAEEPTCVEPPAACEGNEDCPAGTLCKINRCEEGCNNNSDCHRGWTCHTFGPDLQRCMQACRRNSDCPDQFQCENQVCIREVELCAPCTEDGECGGMLDQCLAGAGGKFCAKDCSTSRTCVSGYRCERIGDKQYQCVPASGECSTTCPRNPCPAGEICNTASGRCHSKLDLCDPCTNHTDCSADARCVEFGQGRFCLQPCPEGASCLDHFRCISSGSQPFCLPITGTCDRCANTICGPLAPHCNPEDGTCLECLSDRHCAQNETCSSSNQCMAQGPVCGGEEDPVCVAPTSLCYEQRCLECLTLSDCPGANTVCYHFRCLGADFCQRVQCPAGTTCDVEARRCLETGTCTTDADCPGRRCDDIRGVCFNADGRCVSSGECPPRLECDPAYQVCIGCLVDSDCRPLQKCWPLGDANRSRFCSQI